MEKNIYDSPFLTITIFDCEDVISTSDFTQVEQVDEIGFKYAWE